MTLVLALDPVVVRKNRTHSPENTISFTVDRFVGISEVGSPSNRKDLRFYLTRVSGYSMDNSFTFPDIVFEGKKRPLYYPNPESPARAGFQFTLENGKQFVLQTIKAKDLVYKGVPQDGKNPLINSFKVTIGEETYSGITINRRNPGVGRHRVSIRLTSTKHQHNSGIFFKEYVPPMEHLIDLEFRAIYGDVQESAPVEYRLLSLKNGKSTDLLDRDYRFNNDNKLLFYPNDCWGALNGS